MRILCATLALLATASPTFADRLSCDLAQYKTTRGLIASVAEDTLVVTWDGDRDVELRARFAIDNGIPTIREVAARPKGGQWKVVIANAAPEFRVVSGRRRITDQQLQPLRRLKIPITEEVIQREQWQAFWDAPLYIEGSGVRPPTHGTSIPPIEGLLSQPGLPRKPDEVNRASADFHAKGCEVKTDGGRLEITFPGADLGIFSGRLEYLIYRGTNLFRQALIAKTDRPSVAYKYDAGLTGLAIQPTSRVVWRDLGYRWQDYKFGGATNTVPMVLRTSNRTVFAEGSGGSIAAFPPPHNFFGARETEQTLGYNYYRKNDEASFAIGVHQAENEEDTEFLHNFALRNARPGTWQRMTVFFYVSPEPVQAMADSALAFTHGDRFKAVPGYKVMGTHYHTSITGRLKATGVLPDLDAVKAAGINIYAPIDGPRSSGLERLEGLAAYYQTARLMSDKDFLVMPNEEHESNTPALGGHNDLLISKPIYWTAQRAEGQPFVEDHPVYGKVYHLVTPADMMEMARRENMLIYMPHPRAKGSTGYPDAIKDTAHFLDANYRGIGFRWGMGIDGSETRLCEYRCLQLFDDMNNWVADLPTPPKFIHAIAETRSDIGERGKVPGDDTYGMSPVNYVKLDRVPTVDDMSPIIDAMRRGDYFVTSGEVLIPSYSVAGSGNQRTVIVDVEWTFPLDFVEVVWGDGVKTDRQIISTADLAPFGKKHFEIPLDAAGKKWVRLAAWDTAGNGALAQPVKLNSALITTTTGGR
jgi:hypothetical protein